MCGKRVFTLGLAVLAVALLSASPAFAQGFRGGGYGYYGGGGGYGYHGHHGHHGVCGYPSGGAYWQGYQNGFSQGYAYGYYNGYSTGYPTGYYNGYSTGFANGYYGNGWGYGRGCGGRW